MTRDFRSLIAGERCWDAEVMRLYLRSGIPRVDCMLQNREEMIGLCEWIEAEGVSSYLEIGIWTGRQLTTLQRLFRFGRVAACDLAVARQHGLTIRVPFEADFFEGCSRSEAFEAWHAARAPFDLVFVDGDHSYEGVRYDFELSRRLGARHIAVHDIVGASTPEVARFWRELGGRRTEIVRDNVETDGVTSAMGIGIWHRPE